MSRFKKFLLTEEKLTFGKRVNNVLSDLKSIQEDMDNLGTRHLASLVEDVVNQIRGILHSHWESNYFHFLKDLQKIGVALLKTIEEKGDLRDVIPTAVQALEEVASKIKTRMNDLSVPGEEVSVEDLEQTSSNNQEENSEEQEMSL